MPLVCIVLQPGALELARYAHQQDKLALNLGDNTFQWAAAEGWTTPGPIRGKIPLISKLIEREYWTTLFLKKAIENEENLGKAIDESGADLMLPLELFTIENESYVINR